jgi:hypothetical protein
MTERPVGTRPLWATHKSGDSSGIVTRTGHAATARQPLFNRGDIRSWQHAAPGRAALFFGADVGHSPTQGYIFDILGRET